MKCILIKRPFAGLCWDAVGLSKQRKAGLEWYEFLCFGIPTVQFASLHNSLCTMCMPPDPAEGMLSVETGEPRIVGNFHDLCKITELDKTRNHHNIYRFNTSVCLSVGLSISHSSQFPRPCNPPKENVDTKISPKSILIHFHIIYVTKTWSQLLPLSFNSKLSDCYLSTNSITPFNPVFFFLDLMNNDYHSLNLIAHKYVLCIVIIIKSKPKLLKH